MSEPESSNSHQQVTQRSLKALLPTAPLPEHIGQNIEAIVALHSKAEREVPRHQRIIEAIAAFFGQPNFLYGSIVVVSIWLLLNLVPGAVNTARFDPYPFETLQFLLGLGSFLIATGVLIKQYRQDKLAEQRVQLSLQLNLLSEQKIAKLIALVEELRQDLPNVQNRHDPEVETMQQAADPQMVMQALEEALTEELNLLQDQESSQNDR